LNIETKDSFDEGNDEAKNVFQQLFS